MKNKICLVLMTVLFFVGVYTQNIEHYDQGQTGLNKGQLQQLPIKYEFSTDNQQREHNYDDILQMLESEFRRKRTTNNDIGTENSDDLYEIFLRDPLPLNINLDTTPPWAIQILAQLMNLREKCALNQNSKKPRPGRRSSMSDEEFSIDRNRPPLSPRRGKKSLFKPRMGRSED